jgi:hypothetical protein
VNLAQESVGAREGPSVDGRRHFRRTRTPVNKNAFKYS